MRHSNALAIEPAALEPVLGERRAPRAPDDSNVARAAETAGLRWPDSWPAALYRGDQGAEWGAACKVNLFSAAGAHLTMPDPPPVGALAALKFPFTIYLRGRIAWRRGKDFELQFDEETRRSARLVEEVLLDRSAYDLL